MYRIAVIGLGLMGGSLAYALRGFRNAYILGVDKDSETCQMASLNGAVDEICDSATEAVGEADLSIFCTYPHQILKDIKDCANHFKNDSVVTEIAGLKREIGHALSGFLPNGVDYVGIHPMAGKAVGGFCNAEGSLFENTGFIITPVESTKESSIDLMREMAKYIKASRVVVEDAESHDAIIAYSSDLMHIAAAGLCMDFHPDTTKAFTAGAFRDCTRIADIHAGLWTELLTKNKDFVIPQLERYIDNLSAVREALVCRDEEKLYALLDRAQVNKRELEKR